MKKIYKIGKEPINLLKIEEIINNNISIALSEDAKKNIINCREFLDQKMKNSGDPIYGINTGFGSLYNHKIDKKDLSDLQRNLVLSHACGTGEEVPFEIVKIMLILKIQSLSFGYSAVQLKTVNRLIDMFNNNIIPVVYEQGSLGASGDLAPLAHLSLPLIGMGEVNTLAKNDNSYYKKRKSSIVMKEMAWDVIDLKSKEGLALLNGTQFMSAYGILSLIKAKRLSYFSDMIGSISLEAFDGRSECFDELLHKVRPYKGQLKSAKNIRQFLYKSKIQKSKKKHVQDPYSFRCMPQVHGATKDVISHVQNIFETEVNSVTDNPTIFIKKNKVISGGNFHGQPLAMSMDYLSIAISELGSISERRTYQLISGQRGLPPYLISDSGLNSGLMIPQYTAASIVSQNKQLSAPASVDSIVSSNGQEDHVSMGANAATKLYKIINNTERILAIELLNAAQALELRNIKSSDFIEELIRSFRLEVKFLKKDRLLYEDIEKSIEFLSTLSVDSKLL